MTIEKGFTDFGRFFGISVAISLYKVLDRNAISRKKDSIILLVAISTPGYVFPPLGRPRGRASVPPRRSPR